MSNSKPAESAENQAEQLGEAGQIRFSRSRRIADRLFARSMERLPSSAKEHEHG